MWFCCDLGLWLMNGKALSMCQATILHINSSNSFFGGWRNYTKQGSNQLLLTCYVIELREWAGENKT
jgi:endogenous inhibitor of DNA gyrase (YacG/DUF329 family)